MFFWISFIPLSACLWALRGSPFGERNRTPVGMEGRELTGLHPMGIKRCPVAYGVSLQVADILLYAEVFDERVDTGR